MLQASGNRPWPVAGYLIMLSAITILSVWSAAETHRTEMDTRA
jgi:hypothetical protein